MSEITKNQHYISQGIMKVFFDEKKCKLFETLIEEHITHSTKIENTMCSNYTYEDLKTLPVNQLETFFANNYDAIIKENLILISSTLKNGRNVDIIYHILEKIMYLFLVAYYKSMALLIENSPSADSKRDDKSIGRFLKYVLDNNYIYEIVRTIMLGYNFTILESGDNEFMLSDQYISTCSLDVKSSFIDCCNRLIGMNNTMILIPVTTKNYILFYNGNVPKYITSNTIVKLDTMQVREINDVIYQNSYIKVIGNNKDNLDYFLEKYRDTCNSKKICVIGNNKGDTHGYSNKKEVFFYEKDKQAYEMFSEFLFVKYRSLNREDKCICGSDKKYILCCFDIVEKCEQLLEKTQSKRQLKFNIDDNLIVEKNIEIPKDYYTDILLSFEKMKELRKKNR